MSWLMLLIIFAMGSVVGYVFGFYKKDSYYRGLINEAYQMGIKKGKSFNKL